MQNKTQITISAGRAILKKAGVGTHVIMRSFLMGETINEISVGFGVQPAHVEQAIRYELAVKYSPPLAKELLRNGSRRRPDTKETHARNH